MSITIYGASDDLIEIDGDISEEWYLHDDEDGDLLVLSNGAVLRIAYTVDGVWRITPVIVPTGVGWDFLPAVSEDDDNYSDRLTIDGVAWVAHAKALAR